MKAISINLPCIFFSGTIGIYLYEESLFPIALDSQFSIEQKVKYGLESKLQFFESDFKILADILGRNAHYLKK